MFSEALYLHLPDISLDDLQWNPLTLLGKETILESVNSEKIRTLANFSQKENNTPSSTLTFIWRYPGMLPLGWIPMQMTYPRLVYQIDLAYSLLSIRLNEPSVK